MNELVEICRHESQEFWHRVSNARFDSEMQEGIAAKLMANSANKYVEYKNCGVVYRIVRLEDLPQYMPCG